MAAAAILDQQKFEILMVSPLKGPDASACQISHIKIGQTVAEIGRPMAI